MNCFERWNMIRKMRPNTAKRRIDDICSIMKQAIMEARKSPQRSKHGCVIVNRGHIISHGFNKFRIRPYTGGSSYTSIHAEIEAINSIPRRLLKKSKIYIICIFKDWGNMVELNHSHPCKDCAIKLAKFKKYGIKVYYSTPMIIRM